MVHMIVDGRYRQTNSTNESPENLQKREELRLAEIALIRQVEEVAAPRRGLPKGTPLKDDQFQAGPFGLKGGPARFVKRLSANSLRMRKEPW